MTGGFWKTAWIIFSLAQVIRKTLLDEEGRRDIGGHRTLRSVYADGTAVWKAGLDYCRQAVNAFSKPVSREYDLHKFRDDDALSYYTVYSILLTFDEGKPLIKKYAIRIGRGLALDA